MLLRKDGDRKWVVFSPRSLAAASSRVCNGNDLPDVWMDAQMYWLQPASACFPLLLLSAAALSRETEGGRHVKRRASKGVHLATLFADHAMHTGTPNHTAANQCGGLGVEGFKVNKHHSSLAETAGGYVHLGSTPALLLYGHSFLLLYSNG